MSKLDLVVIVGPQSSGKTTAWKFLKNKYGDQVKFFEEINPYVVFPKEAKLGGIVMTSEMQSELHRVDVKILEDIRDNFGLKVFETLMFHAVYYPEGFDDYRRILRGKKVGVMFIDVSPEVSFKRRRNEYLKRIKKEIEDRSLSWKKAEKFKEEMMKKYRQRIEKLYPKWLEVLERIDYAEEKVVIENDYLSEEEFLAEVENVFLRMIS